MVGFKGCIIKEMAVAINFDWILDTNGADDGFSTLVKCLANRCRLLRLINWLEDA